MCQDSIFCGELESGFSYSDFINIHPYTHLVMYTSTGVDDNVVESSFIPLKAYCI